MKLREVLRAETFTVLCIGGPYDKLRLEVPFFRDKIPDEIRSGYEQLHNTWRAEWVWVWKDLLAECKDGTLS